MKLDLDVLASACRAGGASVLTVVTELAPAGGLHAAVAPPRYLRGTQPTYAFERRFVDVDGSGPQALSCVVLDSKGSQLNRCEDALSLAIADGVAVVAATPRIRVTYDGKEPITCLQLPHRAFDGHIRAGTVDGNPVTAHESYRAARNSTAANARPLLEMSPISLAFGAWDSTRKSDQVRVRSALVGEIIGVLAHQDGGKPDIDPRGAARFDQVSPSVRLSAADMSSLLADQEDELSGGNIDNIKKDIARAKKDGTISASPLGLGSIPPSLDSLGLVACQRIIRSHVLSFSALRQLRFGLGAEGDAAARALLAALALDALARSYAELVLRANCDLVETAPPVAKLDGRYGAVLAFDFPSIEEADTLLAEAISAAKQVGVRWDGQIFDVVGNPIVSGGTVADGDEA